MDNARFSNPLIMAFIATVICTIFSLTYRTMGYFDSLYPSILILFAPLVNIVQQIFLNKQRSTRSLVLLSSILVFAIEMVILFFDRSQSTLRNVMALPVLVAISAFSIKLLLKPICYNSLLRLFDSSVVFYIVTIILISINSYSIDKSYMSVCGVAFVFISVLVARNRLSKVPVLLLVSFGIIFVAMQAIGLSEYVKEGVDALIHLFSRFVEAFMSLIAKIMAFLPSIPHKKGGNLIPVVSDSSYRVSDVVALTVSARILSITTIIITLLVSILIAVKLLGRKKIVWRVSHKAVGAKIKEGLSFFSAIRKTFISFRNRIRTRVFLHANKNNALGLYFLIEKRMCNTPYSRMKAETPRCFLKRVEPCFSAEMKPFIAMIANDIERYFYANGFSDLQSISSAHWIRKEVRKACFSIYLTTLTYSNG